MREESRGIEGEFMSGSETGTVIVIDQSKLPREAEAWIAAIEQPGSFSLELFIEPKGCDEGGEPASVVNLLGRNSVRVGTGCRWKTTPDELYALSAKLANVAMSLENGIQSAADIDWVFTAETLRGIPDEEFDAEATRQDRELQFAWLYGHAAEIIRAMDKDEPDWRNETSQSRLLLKEIDTAMRAALKNKKLD